MKRWPKALTCGAALLLAAVTPAAAAAPGPVVRQVVVGSGQTVLPVVIGALTPGSVVTSRYEVRRAGSLHGGQWTSLVSSVVDLENGCGPAEVAAGDTTCSDADGAGELSPQLTIEQQWSSPTGGCAGSAPSTAGGPLAQAVGSRVVAPNDVSTAAVACLVVSVGLRSSANNTVQSDSADLALQIGLLGARHPGDLTDTGGGFGSGMGSGIGSGIGSGFGSGGIQLGGGSLPHTGFELRNRLELALLLASVGVLLAALARRRRQDP